jgi:hypothetical protein
MASAGYTLTLGRYRGNVQVVKSTAGAYTIDRPWGWTKSYNAGGVRGALDAGGDIRFTWRTKGSEGSPWGFADGSTFYLEAKQIYAHGEW